MNSCTMYNQGPCLPHPESESYENPPFFQESVQEQDVEDWMKVLSKEVRAQVHQELQSFAKQWLAPLHSSSNPTPYDEKYESGILGASCSSLVNGCFQGEDVGHDSFPLPPGRDKTQPSQANLNEKARKLAPQDLRLTEKPIADYNSHVSLQVFEPNHEGSKQDALPKQKEAQKKQPVLKGGSGADPSADQFELHHSHVLGMAKGWRKEERLKRSTSNLMISGEHLKAREKLKGEWQKFIENVRFTSTMGVCIVLNAIMFGVQAQYQARHRFEEPKLVFKILEVVFCFIFLVELVLRMIVYGKHFFVGHERGWNIFDFVIVGMAVVDLLDEMAGGVWQD
eukprot:gnl/MRDRNA2_/MRDRNA2_80083_c0_seq4.p1 gnl/MRDRNA2_/MRDRNA2_80083_c0~~gnl/MRDRNA2_/MRDRNA2_80083_c0_seq4.p1  ORF type:complete len:339 (+),score=66.51 gnl/MRDRNA2_/MRDRNA2_80083_c0_seq4:110-1126(+)